MSTELDVFVRESLAQGLERSAIREVLLRAGWREDELTTALSAYAEIDFPVPVPRPKPYLQAREAFLYLVSFIALYVTAFNLLLVLLIFGSIVLGIINRREALINVGIIFFVIDLSTRYIELTVDMLDTSLAFVVGGLLLLGVGYGMERARRQLLRQFGITRDHRTEENNDS